MSSSEILFKSINLGYNQWGQYPSLYKQRAHEEKETKSSEFKSETNSKSDLKISQSTCLSTARRACRQTAQFQLADCQCRQPWGPIDRPNQYNSTFCICVFNYQLSTVFYCSSLLLLLLPSVWIKKSYELDFYPLPPQGIHSKWYERSSKLRVLRYWYTPEERDRDDNKLKILTWVLLNICEQQVF